MARIRSVHPDICKSETMASISASAERTFVRLWTACDDFGRAEANPKLLKAALYPLHDDMSVDLVVADIEELERNGVVVTYETAGRRYLAIRPESWAEYQHPSKPTPSKLPPPPGIPESTPGGPGPSAGSPGGSEPDDRTVAESPTDSDPEESPGIPGSPALEWSGEGDRRRTRGRDPATNGHHPPPPPSSPPKGGSSPSNPPAANTDGFDDFWAAYPARHGQKLGKGKALDVWKKLSAKKRAVAAAAVRTYAAHCASTDTYAKDAPVWLRDWDGVEHWAAAPASANGHPRAAWEVPQ